MEPNGSGNGRVTRTAIIGMLLRHHGRRAVRVAANRANKLAGDGDRDGALEWLRISEEVVRKLKDGETPES